MGNTISRKISKSDQLIKIEENILKIEVELRELQNHSYIKTISVLSLITMPLFSYLFYLLEINFLVGLILLILFLAGYYYVSSFITERRKAILIKRLSDLKEQRKKLVELCKNDPYFASTKNIIEKYEIDETRDSFFSQIAKKKRSRMDSVADFVMDNDPEKSNALICRSCGMHNGLIDPKNNNFSVFYCYHCKAKNERKLKTKSGVSSSEEHN